MKGWFKLKGDAQQQQTHIRIAAPSGVCRRQYDLDNMTGSVVIFMYLSGLIGQR